FVLGVSGTAAVLWDVRPGPALKVTLRYPPAIVHAKFSPIGDRLVTCTGGAFLGQFYRGSKTETAVWDAHNGELVLPPITNASGIEYSEFSPDGQRIAAASVSG